MNQSINRALSFLEAFGDLVAEVFEAYDDMCESDRRRLVKALSERRFESALSMVDSHASFRKASEDVRVERTPIVDEETGRSFVTVEGGADPDLQHHFRNIRISAEIEKEDSNA